MAHPRAVSEPQMRGSRRVPGRRAWPLMITLALAAMVSIVGTPVAPAAAATTAQPVPGSDRINPSGCLDAWAEVEQWVDDWTPAMQAELPTGAVGVWIGLRWSGRLVGEGQNIGPVAAVLATNPRGMEDTRPSAMPRAFREAMADASANTGGNRDRGEDAALDAIIPGGLTDVADAALTLEMQFAHNLVRIRANTRETLLEQIDPGREGIILGTNGRYFAAFPAAMLAAEHAPSVALLRLLNAAEVGLTDFADGLASGAIRIWSFEVVHLAQSSPDDPPIFLTRGTRPVPEHAMSRSAIETFGHELAANLMQQRIRRGNGDVASPMSGLGLLGPYRAGLDRHDPLVAPPETQALVALALHRYGTMPIAGSGAAAAGNRNDPEAAARMAAIEEQQAAAREIAVAIMRDLADRRPSEPNPASGIAAPIFFVIADREIPVTFASGSTLEDRYRDLQADAQRRVNALYDADTGFLPEMTPLERAALAYALARRDVVDAAWRSTDFTLYPGLLPWIGFAELRVGEADGQGSNGSGRSSGGSRRDRRSSSASQADDAAQRAALGLRVLRETIWERQATLDSAGGTAADAVGGIDLGPTGSTERPDWRTARALTFMSVMLRDPSLTEPDERLAEVTRIVRSMRFLRQLSLREADLYRLRNAEQALGGVRNTLWFDTVDPEATATTLLAVLETLSSLDALSDNRSGGRRGR